MTWDVTSSCGSMCAKSHTLIQNTYSGMVGLWTKVVNFETLLLTWWPFCWFVISDTTILEDWNMGNTLRDFQAIKGGNFNHKGCQVKVNTVKFLKLRLFNIKMASLLRPLSIYTCPLLRLLCIYTCPLLRLLCIYTCPLLRLLSIYTCPLLRPLYIKICLL